MKVKAEDVEAKYDVTLNCESEHAKGMKGYEGRHVYRPG